MMSKDKIRQNDLEWLATCRKNIRAAIARQSSWLDHLDKFPDSRGERDAIDRIKYWADNAEWWAGAIVQRRKAMSLEENSNGAD